MKTKIHFYQFSLPRQKEEWEKLWSFLVSEVGTEKRHKAFGKHDTPFNEGEEIELDEKNLSSNQWITTGENGVRVFDWWQEVNFGHHGEEIRSYKKGHWLEQTEEMRAIRENTVVCGYCSHKGPAQEEGEFCPSCLGSSFLEEKELHLLRMRPVARHFPDRPPLTDQEREELLPKYIRAQTVAEGIRAKKRRKEEREKVKKKHEEVKEKHAKVMQAATAEYLGMMWLWDRRIPLDNVIYYTHTGKFSFGWRSDGVSDVVADELLTKLEGFPYPVEVKRKKG